MLTAPAKHVTISQLQKQTGLFATRAYALIAKYKSHPGFIRVVMRFSPRTGMQAYWVISEDLVAHLNKRPRPDVIQKLIYVAENKKQKFMHEKWYQNFLRTRAIEFIEAKLKLYKGEEKASTPATPATPATPEVTTNISKPAGRVLKEGYPNKYVVTWLDDKLQPQTADHFYLTAIKTLLKELSANNATNVEVYYKIPIKLKQTFEVQEP
jgi:hypothetical protein